MVKRQRKVGKSIFVCSLLPLFMLFCLFLSHSLVVNALANVYLEQFQVTLCHHRIPILSPSQLCRSKRAIFDGVIAATFPPFLHTDCTLCVVRCNSEWVNVDSMGIHSVQNLFKCAARSDVFLPIRFLLSSFTLGRRARRQQHSTQASKSLFVHIETVDRFSECQIRCRF